MGVSEEEIRSEVELLKSNSLLSQVVIDAELYVPGRRFFGLFPPHVIKDQAEKEVFIAQAAELLGKQLKIEPVRKTNLISVSYKSRYPELSTKVLQSLATRYLEKHVAVHRGPESFEFFEHQAREFQAQSVAAAKRLQEFNVAGGVVAAQQEKQAVLQKEADFQASLAQTEASIAETTNRIATLRSKLASTAPRRVTQVRTTDNGALEQQLESTLLQLQLKYSDMRSKYAPEFEPLVELKSQIEQTERALAEAKNNKVQEETQDFDPTHDWMASELAKANADLASLKARASSTRETVLQYRDAAAKLDQQQIAQDALLRDAKVAEDNYLLYLRKQEEARIADALDQKRILNVAIADAPSVPVLPVGWPLSWNLLLIVSLACAGGASLAFVADRYDPSFRTPDEVRTYLETTVLGSLPRLGP